MRVVSDLIDSAVSSTTSGDRLVAHAWRGDGVVAADLDVTDFSMRWDAAQQVQGQVTLTVADPTGALSPIGMDDPLAPGGSRVQLFYVWGDSRIPPVPLGMWRIRRSRPAETWRFYRGATSQRATGWGEGPWGLEPWGLGGVESVAEVVDGVPLGALLVHSGGTVQIEADEESASIVLARLDSEPVVESTSLAEVRRLLSAICSVSNPHAVADRPVPPGLVYEESRMDAVEDHLDRIGAAWRMAGDGSLEVVPAEGVGPVWTIAAGDMGVLVNVAREPSDEGFYNQVISRGETEAGTQLRGFAELPPQHPLSAHGPMGPIPLFHRSPAESASGVQADAQTLLANRMAAGEVSIEVDCLLHPGLQPHDVVALAMPTRSGEQTLDGRVTSIAWGSSSGVIGKSMRLTLAVSADALEAVAWRVRDGA